MSLAEIVDGPADADRVFLFAHGAGAGMDHPFMDAVARGVGRAGVRVVRFEFPYMARRRADGKKRPPDSGPKLSAHFLQQVERLGTVGKLVLGGKSMGGRIASALVDQVGAAGLVALGFPFHAVGKPERLERVEHLREMKTPALIVQGSRDSFGNYEQVRGYRLPDHIELCWLEDGNHSFVPRQRSGLTLEQHIDTTVARIADFIGAL